MRTHTIIVESGDGLVGLPVEGVKEVIRVREDHIHLPPKVSTGVDSAYLRGVCRVDERLLIYLDVEKDKVTDSPTTPPYATVSQPVNTHPLGVTAGWTTSHT